MVEPLGHGRYRVEAGGYTGLAYAVTDGGRTWVFVAGHTHVIEERDARDERQPREIDHGVALSAPMPATVLSVKVAPGQDVQAGDVLIVLEAMKMELPITAPRAGRIQSVNCRERELVQPGTPLLQFDVPS